VVLFRTGGFNVVNFGLFAGIGGVVASWLALTRLIQIGMPAGKIAPFLFVCVPLLALAGSRLMEILVNIREVTRDPTKKLRETGFAFQGGLILITAGLIGFALVMDLSVLALLDCFALSLPLGHAFGRLGCLTYGCCHGLPTTSRWSLRFENPESKVAWKSGLRGVPLIPTQLYSVISNVSIFAFLNLVAASGPMHVGRLSALYLLVDAPIRFVMEFFRWPPGSESRLLKPFQWVCLSLFVAGIALSALVTQMPPVDFSELRLLADAMVRALSFFPWFGATFLILLLSFGVHGPRLGRL